MNLTVVVPIYGALPELRRCLHSLLLHGHHPAQLLLIDDASPDPGIAAYLGEFASLNPKVRLQRNPVNLGFVGTVNRAMALCQGDVVLLNSDTEVSPGWLEALIRAASEPQVATVTPWSNNAEICSLPALCRSAPIPPDLPALAAGLQRRRPSYPELPTAVGFCMYIRRAALAQLGDFDRATFGRGYGEENDFCMRASAFGWRHLLCDDAYVAHRGGASFAATDARPGGDALKRLLARYPGYHAMIADFIARDPIAPVRTAVLAEVAAAGLVLPQSEPPQP